jgi:hypothetical protein
MLDFLFNLKTFCLFSVAMIGLLLWNNQQLNRKVTFGLLFGLTLFAIGTMYHYVFPSESYFYNTDYHCLEHEGFKFDKTLALVHSEERETALWDHPDRKGALVLSRTADAFALEANRFTEPIFIETNTNIFKLANPVFSDKADESIEIQVNTFSLKINMKPTGDSKTVQYHCEARFDTANRKQISAFDAALKQGYSVGDILAKTANMPDFPVWVTDMLKKTYLIRPVLNRIKPPANLGNPLLLQPSHELLAANPIIRLNGKEQTKIDINRVKKNIVLKNNAKFYVGFGLNQSPVLYADGKEGNKLLYEFGDKKPLKRLTKTDKGLFMTSDSRSVVENDAVAGYYYPLFDSDDNIHHFRGSLQYCMGNAKEQLAFRMFDYDNEHGVIVSDTVVGKSIALQPANADGATWLFKINDLRANNPLQFWQMMALMWFFCLGALICLQANRYYSMTELVVYIVLMALLTVRCVLLWRMSTFPPYEDIGYLFYVKMLETRNLFGVNTLRHFLNTFYGVSIFFTVIFSFKKWILPNFAPRIAAFSEKIILFFDQKTIFSLVGILAGYGILAGGRVVVAELERFCAIFLPVVWFFITDYFWKCNQIIAIETNTDPGRSNDFRLLRGVNWIFCLGYLGISDAGFGAIFGVFTVLYALLRTLFRGNDIFGQKKLRYLLPFLPLMILLIGAPWGMSALFSKPDWTSWGFALLSILGVAVLTWQLKQGTLELSAPFAKYVPIIGSVFAILVVAGCATGKVQKVIQAKTYIKYRAEVLVKKVDDIITNEAAGSKNSQKILQAAQNQWYIAYHKKKGSEVGWSDFTITPHFQKGSSYITQSTDLVTVRYIIGEHGSFLILLILLLWFSVVLSISRQGAVNPLKSTLMAVSVLLLSIALFIWMAATNRFVFFGQDMPLLSLQSLLTLVFALSFLCGIVVMQHHLVASELEQYYDVSQGNPRKSVRASGILILIISVISIVNNWISVNIASFDIANTMEKTEAIYERLNETFEAFQKANFTKKELDDKLSARKVLEAFDKQYNLSAEVIPENSILNDKFSRSLFKKLMTEDINQNAPSKILHWRKSEDEYWRFAINNQYYRLRSPEEEKNTWKGNVIAPVRDEVAQFNVHVGKKRSPVAMETGRVSPSLMDEAGFAGLNTLNLDLSFIPGRWTPDSQHLVLLRTGSMSNRQAQYRGMIQNSQEVIDMSRSNGFGYALKNHDVVRLLNNAATTSNTPSNEARYRIDYARSDVDYWAKNVWLNGRQRFFYPAGEKCLWTYHFANLMNLRHAQLATEPEKHQNEFKDVEISLDPTLTKEMYDYLKAHYATEAFEVPRVEKDRAFNLVAMDGDGRIALMADYKKGLSTTQRINPNKMERYQALMDQLYLESRISTERRIFGNGCLQYMNPGPGSSFKPIVYDAVTSAYNFDWDNLQTTAPVSNDPQYLETIGRHKILKVYAGKQIPNWTFLGGDKNFELCRSQDYLPYSSNMYHSVVAFIGSYTPEEIAAQAFLKPSETLGIGERFPQVSYKGRLYGFGKNNWAKDFGSNQSLLAIGLGKNYRLPMFREQTSSKLNLETVNEQINLMSGYDKGDKFFKETESSHKLWSFPECSVFSQLDRRHNILVEGLKQSTLGAFPVQITPLKMAEMSGKMFSANPGFRATIWNKRKKTDTIAPLSVHTTWTGGEAEFLRFKGQTIFASMNQQAIGGGTGIETVKTKLAQYQREKGWRFYSKSGTINYPYGDIGEADNKLYTIVISKNDLHPAAGLTREVLKNNRFYVLYFSISRSGFNNRSHGNEVSNFILTSIDKVVNSAAFKNYMQ